MFPTVDVTSINSALIALVVVLLSWYYWYRRPRDFPPGPRGIPILGAAPFAGAYVFKSLMKWSEKYGAVFSARMGTDDWVILNDYDSIYQVHHIFTKGYDNNT